MAKYLFQPDKKILKQGFFLTDEQQKVVYEAVMDKWSLLGASHFTFTNHLTGVSQEHQVGHTVTISSEDTLGQTFIKDAHFKFDGVKIWDYLHKQGVELDADSTPGKLAASCRVSKNGLAIAEIVTSSPRAGAILTSMNYLEVTTDPDNLDAAFLVAFAMARTQWVP